MVARAVSSAAPRAVSRVEGEGSAPGPPRGAAPGRRVAGVARLPARPAPAFGLGGRGRGGARGRQSGGALPSRAAHE